MAEFRAGYWLIGVVIYFFIFFWIVGSIIEASKDYPDTMNMKGVYQDRINFDSDNVYLRGTNISDVTGADTDSVSSSTLIDALSFATGVGASNLGIGLPAEWQFLFSFIFFYIPAILLVFSIYMLIPFI